MVLIKYSDKIFLTDKVKKNIDKYRKDIEGRSYISRACLIRFAANEDDVFDIIPLINLKISEVYNDITVIGIAESRKAAINLCAEMTKMYLDENSDVSMRHYFESMLYK